MKFTQKMSVLAAGVALAAGMLPHAVHADAIAQSIVQVSNFTFSVGNGALGVGASLAPFLTNPTTTLASGSNASLTGVGSVNNPGVNSATSCVGACGFYTPFSQVTGAPSGTFAASTGNQSGNSLAPAGASGNTDAIISLKPTGMGSSGSNTSLNGSFDLTLLNATKIGIAFDAKSFLRAMLTQNGSATSQTSFSFRITNILSPNVSLFSWSPDGVLGGAAGVSGTVGGFEFADAFNLTDNIGASLAGDNFSQNNALGRFEAETNTLGAGSYRFSLSQTSNVNAQLIPEPGSLALLGIALFGAAAVARRRSAKK